MWFNKSKSIKKADKVIKKIIAGNREWTADEQQTYTNHSVYIEQRLLEIWIWKEGKQS